MKAWEIKRKLKVWKESCKFGISWLLRDWTENIHCFVVEAISTVARKGHYLYKLYFPCTNFIFLVQTLFSSHKLYFPCTKFGRHYHWTLLKFVIRMWNKPNKPLCFADFVKLRRDDRGSQTKKGKKKLTKDEKVKVTCIVSLHLIRYVLFSSRSWG